MDVETPKPKKAKREIRQPARGLIRHAYDQVITHAARLVSFSLCGPLPEMGEIEARQNALAIDDLMAFALHVRRLIDASGAKVGHHTMAAAADGGKTPALPISRVLNTIIHHRHMEITRRKSDLSAPGKDLTLAQWLEDRKQGHLPIVIARSDKGGYIGFRVDHFVTAVIDGIINPVVEFCDDRGLHLEDDDYFD